MNPGIYIESYGCSNSQAEAEIMSGLVRQAGFEIADEGEADLVIVVTCQVKSPTEQKILYRIGQLKGRKLIIAGCMPEGIYSRLVKIAPKASLLSTHHVKDVVQAVEKTLEGRRVEYLGKSEEVKLCLPKVRKNPLIDIVPISSGCNSACSYCCVRLAKGRLFSYPKDMIISEIESSLKDGCKEIWLTAQDTASYGYDKGPRLSELLNETSKIPGKFFVRVGMMNPKNVLPMASDLVEAFKSEKIYKFVHLPIQSGSDSVLSSMNRGYSVSEFEDIVKMFRNSSRCQLWTDVIVGYPTESEEDFKKSLDVVCMVKPDWVNVSKFGARAKTEASRLKPLPAKVVKERSELLSDLVRKVSEEKNEEWVGWEGEILVTERGRKDQWIGRNFAYKPVLVESKDDLMGNLLNVKVTDSSHSHLKGEL